MNEHNFKVGDMVRIRQWEDIKREFGLSDWGVVKSQWCVLNKTKRLSGKAFRIEDIEDHAVIMSGHGIKCRTPRIMLAPFVKKVGQRYEVLKETNWFKKGEIVTLSEIGADSVSWYANVKNNWGLMYDIDHIYSDTRYLDEGEQEQSIKENL